MLQLHSAVGVCSFGECLLKQSSCTDGSDVWRMLSLLIVLTAVLTSTDAALVVVPHNTSAVLGTSVILNCSTNITSRPVNWYCTGRCSANTSSAAVYLLLSGVLTESYAHRIAVDSYTVIMYVHKSHLRHCIGGAMQ